VISNSRESDYDPLDPFAEKEELFESKDIKKSKARELKRRADFLKEKERTKNKVKKPSLFSRIKTFFKELPDREDKKKVYTIFIVGLIVLVLLILAFTFILAPKLEEIRQELEYEGAWDYGRQVTSEMIAIDIANDYDLAQKYESELLERITSTENGSVAQYQYVNALVKLYSEMRDENKVFETLENFLQYDNCDNLTRAGLLFELLEKYKDRKMNDEYIKTIKRIIEMPSEPFNINGESFDVLQEELRIELNRMSKKENL